MAPNWREKMNTTRSARIAGLLIAVLLTAAVHGALLWQFDSLAQEATLAAAAQSQAFAA